MDMAQLISEHGYPVVATVGLGYFIFYVWRFIGSEIKPALGNMHMALIRVIDQTRMLDQDMIRLQQKVNVVIEYRQRQEVLEDAEEKTALREQKQQEVKK